MSEFFDSLHTTEYGQTLDSNVRFGRFKPEFLPNEVWHELLGDDVNNYRHMQYTAGLTAWYIYEAERLGTPFTQDEQDQLMTTAWVHDFAEAIDGDIPDPDKVEGEDVDAQERRSFLQVAGTVTDKPEDLADYVLPVMQGSHPLARHFRAIEIIGYMETGKRALRATHAMGDLQDTYGYSIPELKQVHDSLMSLGTEVVGADYQRLWNKFQDLPVVVEYLKR